MNRFASLVLTALVFSLITADLVKISATPAAAIVLHSMVRPVFMVLFTLSYTLPPERFRTLVLRSMSVSTE